MNKFVKFNNVVKAYKINRFFCYQLSQCYPRSASYKSLHRWSSCPPRSSLMLLPWQPTFHLVLWVLLFLRPPLSSLLCFPLDNCIPIIVPPSLSVFYFNFMVGGEVQWCGCSYTRESMTGGTQMGGGRVGLNVRDGKRKGRWDNG